MSSKLGFVFLIAIFACASNLPSISGAAAEGAVCKDVLTSFIQKQMDVMKVCMEEIHAKAAENGDTQGSAMLCVMKCTLLKEGFLAADGKVDIVSSMKFLDVLPAKTREKAMNLLMKCHDHFDKIVPSDPTCATYEPLFRCAFVIFNQLCDD